MWIFWKFRHFVYHSLDLHLRTVWIFFIAETSQSWTCDVPLPSSTSAAVARMVFFSQTFCFFSLVDVSLFGLPLWDGYVSTFMWSTLRCQGAASIVRSPRNAHWTGVVYRSVVVTGGLLVGCNKMGDAPNDLLIQTSSKRCEPPECVYCRKSWWCHGFILTGFSGKSTRFPTVVDGSR